MMTYNFNDLKSAYKKVGVTKGRVVLLKTDLRWLGPYEKVKKNEVLEAHLNALSDIVDLGFGTIVVSTATTSLCNTSIPFDINQTPSERGILTEFIRKSKGSVRSHHPFMSYTAIGAYAEKICGNVSRHSYGLHSPKERMLELDAMYLSVGLVPRLTCTYVHHIELLMGVPYRYSKEFEHPIVKNDGNIENELFYLYVWYKDMELKRNLNKKIFKHYFKSGYKIKEEGVGLGKIYGYSCVDFCKATSDYLKNDIYGWLDTPPQSRPYRI